MIKIAPKATQTVKISPTLRSWLPLLQVPLDDLEVKLKDHIKDNPLIEIRSRREETYEEKDSLNERINEEDFQGSDANYHRRYEEKLSTLDTIEAMTFNKKSLYDVLYEQLTDDLFPTRLSKDIAAEIIFHINCDGYFEGSVAKIAKKLQISAAEVERVRQRFSYLEPVGVGAVDFKESFLFQLLDASVSDEIYKTAKKLITNFEKIGNFHKEKNFAEAMKVIKTFKNPPAIEYAEAPKEIVPDIFVILEGESLKVSLNDNFYPEIEINDYGLDKKDEFVRQKIKEAKDLVDAIDMRKKTLNKIGLMIVEYQYDFFKGGDIKPLKLVDISEDLGRNASTISRAISDKYLACNRGIFSIKSFFSVSIDDTSTKAIKDYIAHIIKEEPKSKPLSDQKIVEIVQDHFHLKMVRRTITKYREQLNIPKSGERKRLYLLN
ncbi:MAG: RNA polymerase factor sigma-54 [Helicobacteraceae bacterium]